MRKCQIITLTSCSGNALISGQFLNAVTVSGHRTSSANKAACDHLYFIAFSPHWYCTLYGQSGAKEDYWRLSCSDISRIRKESVAVRRRDNHLCQKFPFRQNDIPGIVIYKVEGFVNSLKDVGNRICTLSPAQDILVVTNQACSMFPPSIHMAILS